MAQPTIKELQAKIKTLQDDVKYWKEAADNARAESRAVRLDATKNADLYNKLIGEQMEAANFRGKYEGFREATQMQQRTIVYEKHGAPQNNDKTAGGSYDEARRMRNGFNSPI